MRQKHVAVIARVVVLFCSFLLSMEEVSSQSSSSISAARTPNETPDFNGIWQALGNNYWNVEPHAASPGIVRGLGALGAVPGGLGVVDGGVIPYRSEALVRRNDNFSNRLTRDPAIKCYLPGVPRATYMPFPLQIIQGQSHIMILHEFAGAVRTIYMTDQTEAPASSWMGWSNGRWEGETLVIETTGFNGMTWFDRAGNYHSDQLRVVERLTARSPERLSYEVKIEDPIVFTRPWKMSMPLYRRAESNAELLEFRCVEFVEDLIYGHLRKDQSR